MNLITEYLQSIAGVEIFAIISMLIFIAFFIVMLIHTFSLRKDEIKQFSELPLEDEKEENDHA